MCNLIPPAPESDCHTSHVQGVDIGPLLGKGSFGRVYKGRWKGAMVAIKVLDHALILQDDISRETLLSTSIAHPCVVSPAPWCLDKDRSRMRAFGSFVLGGPCSNARAVLQHFLAAVPATLHRERSRLHSSPASC